MKKQILILATIFLSLMANSQSKGIKIGYIDMEYILENVPDYKDAKNQLEQRAQVWQQEIEAKKNEITKLKESLATEKVLLTKELIDERNEEIKFQETALNDYQQKRFGPTGDLIVQKKLLVQPIQDQVFTAVQDIAESKKYDFVFDKSSDLTMLFASKRYDISDKIVSIINRSTKKTEMTKKQIQEEEEKERKKELIEDNPALSERQKVMEEKKLAREKMMEDKKLAAAEKKKAQEEAKAKLKADHEAKKLGTISDNSNNEKEKDAINLEKTTSDDSKKEIVLEKQEIKNRAFEERKKAIEERKQKVMAEREAAKKAKEAEVERKKEQKNQIKENN
ncbi:OmpH family outer membrane protein [Flavobacterium branchiophilum]|uniref:Outer membrane chaperone Skp (OmpH) n=1 Tax=Flavobacterium branchiophilum (strain FL-15) TaxID=1034807 RepID=G2Z2R2_FLABF|nr:OmpH family outer membrane protein [Flavobacterium branchiophilum]CCB70241.1 Outer membrane chaperone precursor Skp (OmpH) [Flavobacterium branchiophilum FL-15]